MSVRSGGECNKGRVEGAQQIQDMALSTVAIVVTVADMPAQVLVSVWQNLSLTSPANRAARALDPSGLAVSVAAIFDAAAGEIWFQISIPVFFCHHRAGQPFSAREGQPHSLVIRLCQLRSRPSPPSLSAQSRTKKGQ